MVCALSRFSGFDSKAPRLTASGPFLPIWGSVEGTLAVPVLACSFLLGNPVASAVFGHVVNHIIPPPATSAAAAHGQPQE
jgi:hypothetical protein